MKVVGKPLKVTQVIKDRMRSSYAMTVQCIVFTTQMCVLSWPQIVFFFFPELVGFKPTSDLPIPPVPRSGSELMAKIFTCSFLLSEKIIIIICSP